MLITIGDQCNWPNIRIIFIEIKENRKQNKTVILAEVVVSFVNYIDLGGGGGAFPILVKSITNNLLNITVVTIHRSLFFYCGINI